MALGEIYDQRGKYALKMIHSGGMCSLFIANWWARIIAGVYGVLIEKVVVDFYLLFIEWVWRR